MENIVNIFTPKRLGYLVLLILALTLPLYIRGDYYRHIFIMCCIWSICTIAMNIIVGYTGQANLGHGAFFGIGAYSLGIMMLKLSFSFWLALPLACIITTVFGFLIGLPTLRTKGSYFAIATLCFNVLVYIVINRWKGLTGGGDGLTGIPVPSSIRLPFGEIDFSALSTNYYLVLIFLFLTSPTGSHSLIRAYYIRHKGVKNLVCDKLREDLEVEK